MSSTSSIIQPFITPFNTLFIVFCLLSLNISFLLKLFCAEYSFYCSPLLMHLPNGPLSIPCFYMYYNSNARKFWSYEPQIREHMEHISSCSVILFLLFLQFTWKFHCFISLYSWIEFIKCVYCIFPICQLIDT